MFGEAMLEQLSPKDKEYVQKNLQHVAKVGDYARTGLMRGLAIEKRTGTNPYKFGTIGATDSHTSTASAEENNFWGKNTHLTKPSLTAHVGHFSQ